MAINIAPQSRTVPLYQGDDLDTLNTLAAKVKRAEKNKPKPAKDDEDASDLLMSEADPLTEAQAEHDAFAEQAEARAVHVTLRSVARKTWRRLVTEHPPRKDSEEDKQIGVNDDTFGEALLPLCISGIRVGDEKQDYTDDELTEFIDSLSPAQFGLLYGTAFMLNSQANVGPDPKERLSSGATRH